jgi:hypothetical protein
MEKKDGDARIGTADQSVNNVRDTSTIRLRQMIAFKQQNSKSIAPKDGQMMDRLKPYFYKINMSRQSDRHLNKVIKTRINI